jgi:hypothetical protein
MRPIGTVLGLAGASTLVLLTLTWPSPTHADPPPTFTGEGLFGRVTFQGELVRDPGAPSGWVMRLVVENGDDADLPCDLDVSVTRTTVDPGVRSIPPGSIVWQRRERLSIPGHERIVRSEPLPRWLAVQLPHNELASLQATWVSSQLAAPDPARDRLFQDPEFMLPIRRFTLFQVAMTPHEHAVAPGHASSPGASPASQPL